MAIGLHMVWRKTRIIQNIAQDGLGYRLIQIQYIISVSCNNMKIFHVISRDISTNILKGVRNNVYAPRGSSVTTLELSNVYITHVN